ncbi:MAG: nickel pincer cofactor biosynthesis protein LarB [Gammaproteobacteria bacterium]|nr:nickel pincer cofactor biosynthesis protein LarB [Gammaproteobacteria bacterium]
MAETPDGRDWDLTPDDRRRDRLAFDEAIFCQGKSADQIRRLLEHARGTGATALLTRLDADKLASLPNALAGELDYDEISRTALFGDVRAPLGAPRVALVTAGTSDVGVAREASRTLHYYGESSREFYDIGVAGLWRLMERVDSIRELPVTIVVAGMDGALPSVLGGLVPGLVVAVPSSAGYGVAANGLTALNTMLASCAPGLVVVNVDNGYGAACAALRALHATTAR